MMVVEHLIGPILAVEIATAAEERARTGLSPALSSAHSCLPQGAASSPVAWSLDPKIAGVAVLVVVEAEGRYWIVNGPGVGFPVASGEGDHLPRLQ